MYSRGRQILLAEQPYLERNSCLWAVFALYVIQF